MDNSGTFPSYFPPGCPPADAEPADGVVYRVTKNDPPLSEDFLSIHEIGRQPKYGLRKKHQCQRLALSVYRTLTDVMRHLEMFPATGTLIAVGVLDASCGKTKPTPAKERPTHTSWWCFEGIERSKSFKIYEVA
jgi:hypothetical protein